MKLYWKVKRGDKWMWLPADVSEENRVYPLTATVPCECKACVPRQTDGEE